MVEKERNACADIEASTEGINIQKIFYYKNTEDGKDIVIAAANVYQAGKYLKAFHRKHDQPVLDGRFILTSVFAAAAGLATIIVEEFVVEIVNEDTRTELLEYIDE